MCSSDLSRTNAAAMLPLCDKAVCSLSTRSQHSQAPAGPTPAGAHGGERGIRRHNGHHALAEPCRPALQHLGLQALCASPGTAHDSAQAGPAASAPGRGRADLAWWRGPAVRCAPCPLLWALPGLGDSSQDMHWRTGSLSGCCSWAAAPAALVHVVHDHEAMHVSCELRAQTSRRAPRCPQRWPSRCGGTSASGRSTPWSQPAPRASPASLPRAGPAGLPCSLLLNPCARPQPRSHPPTPR